MRRARIPSIAWLLSGGTALALLVLAIQVVRGPGQSQFFSAGDPTFYLLTARALFGHGAAFAHLGVPNEAPYRYGRIGLPLLAWLVGFGRPQFVSWTLIGVELASIAAIPGIAATLLAEYGAPPVYAAFVLLTPGLLLVTRLVYAEPLQIALILLALVLEARGHRRGALGMIAFAILVKETSVLALVPWVWAAARRRDPRQLVTAAAALVPYAGWSLWVRLRVGAFPFLARTYTRTAALSFPGAGMRYAIVHHTPNHSWVVTLTLLTFALAVAGTWASRRHWIAGIAAPFTVLILCLGRNTLFYILETLRLLSVPTVLAILGLVIGSSSRAARTQPRPPQPQPAEPQPGEPQPANPGTR